MQTAGCDGIVTGILNADGSIDKKRCSQLVDLAYPLAVTFHRAFDRCANPFEALEDLIEIGCERVLTSGQHPTAAAGASITRELVIQADERIIVMPGSGIRTDNIIEIAEKTGATEFHSSAKKMKQSAMEYSSHTLNERQETITVDNDEIKKMMTLLLQKFSS